jgi:hypothetical protein
LADPDKQPSQSGFWLTTARTFQEYENCLPLENVKKLESGRWIADTIFAHYSMDIREESLDPEYSETARYLHCVEPAWIRKLADAHSYNVLSKRLLYLVASLTFICSYTAVLNLISAGQKTGRAWWAAVYPHIRQQKSLCLHCL